MSFPSPINVERMFPSLATIETSSESYDEEGSEVDSWSTLHENVKAQLSPLARGEAGQAESDLTVGTFVEGEHRLILYGDFPDVTEADRAIVDGRIFNIRGVERDSWGIANDATGWTILRVREPGARTEVVS